MLCSQTNSGSSNRNVYFVDNPGHLFCPQGVYLTWLTVVDYSNTMYSSYMPILSSTVFDNTRQPYNVTRILTPGFYFDEAAYRNYSRVFLPTTYILSYALQFAVLPALIVHTICWYGKDTLSQFYQTFHKAKDETEGVLRQVSSSSVLSRHLSWTSDPSRQSSAPNLDNLLSQEDVVSEVDDECDVPASWYVITGLAMITVGVYVVEAYANFILPL
jgi:hypothetical protein